MLNERRACSFHDAVLLRLHNDTVKWPHLARVPGELLVLRFSFGIPSSVALRGSSGKMKVASPLGNYSSSTLHRPIQRVDGIDPDDIV